MGNVMSAGGVRRRSVEMEWQQFRDWRDGVLAGQAVEMPRFDRKNLGPRGSFRSSDRKSGFPGSG